MSDNCPRCAIQRHHDEAHLSFLERSEKLAEEVIDELDTMAARVRALSLQLKTARRAVKGEL